MTDTAEPGNLLLRALPTETRRALAPHLERVHLRARQVLDHADGPVRHLYFIERGLISLIKTMDDGRTVEIIAVGPEGLADPQAIFGTGNAMLESVVQVAGTALRISRGVLVAEIARSEALRGLLQRYAVLASNQMAQTAACNALHSIEERCCRWLLIAHDSALGDDFALTHEFLAMMLGVRRAGITVVMATLERAGLVRNRRGQVHVQDREALEGSACECYRAIRSQFDTVYGKTQDAHG